MDNENRKSNIDMMLDRMAFLRDSDKEDPIDLIITAMIKNHFAYFEAKCQDYEDEIKSLSKTMVNQELRIQELEEELKKHDQVQEPVQERDSPKQ